jgi:hypothetical protein
MTKAKDNFENSIRDSEVLLELFCASSKEKSSEDIEVLKRAGLILAVTAWETYVEDVLKEEANKRLLVLSGSFIGNYFESKLNDELKRFHNPTSDKTTKVFKEYLNINIDEGFKFSNYDVQQSKTQLNELISKRGDAAHRSKKASSGVQSAHLIKKDELEKAIKFLKALVASLDQFIEMSLVKGSIDGRN